MPIGHYSRKSLQERFEEKISMEPNTGCWLWIGATTTKNGYGHLWYNGRTVLAPRVAYELYIGPIPEGLHPLHYCDTKECASPYHLFCGTLSDNTQDMLGKKRDNPRRGIHHPNAKLSEEAVIAIKKDPRTHKTIAAFYGVSKYIVRDIKQGRTWTHVFSNGT